MRREIPHRRARRYRRHSKVDENGRNVGRSETDSDGNTTTGNGAARTVVKRTRTRAPSAERNESRWRNDRRSKADKNGGTARAARQTRRRIDQRDEVGDTGRHDEEDEDGNNVNADAADEDEVARVRRERAKRGWRGGKQRGREWPRLASSRHHSPLGLAALSFSFLSFSLSSFSVRSNVARYGSVAPRCRRVRFVMGAYCRGDIGGFPR